jgi:hypothetical protein
MKTGYEDTKWFEVGQMEFKSKFCYHLEKP